MEKFKALLKKRKEFLLKETRTPKVRFLTSLAVHFFAAFTVIFYTSAEVYLGNIADFDFAFSSLLLVMGGAALLATALGVGFSMLLKGRLFNYYVTTVFSISLCFYLQGAFMNSALPSLDGKAVDWHMMTKQAVLNLIVWVICFSIPYFIHFLNRKWWRKVMVYASCLCIVMHIVSFVPMVANADFSERTTEGFYSREDLYTVSDDGDVVVLVLDFFDNEYMETLLNENPDILSEWTGFTRFANTTSMYRQTRPTIDYLLTKTEWTYQMLLDDYPEFAYSESDFLERIDEQGYDINLYVSGPANTEKAYVLSDNYTDDAAPVNPFGMFKSMVNYALYRDMPLIAKSVFWHYTDDISNASIKTENLSLEDSVYTSDDPLFFSDFKKQGLTVKKDRPAFRFVHMRGAHYPYVMDENGNTVNTATATEQQKGSIKIVSEYLKQMKEKGVYDSSTIIIMADHGIVELGEKISRAPLPILFVKPAGADSSKPFTTSLAPVSQEDFHATVLWAVGDENYADYGRTFFEIDENEDRTRRFLYLSNLDGKADRVIREYLIKGDARKFASWSLSGTVYSYNPTK